MSYQTNDSSDYNKLTPAKNSARATVVSGYSDYRVVIFGLVFLIASFMLFMMLVSSQSDRRSNSQLNLNNEVLAENEVDVANTEQQSVEISSQQTLASDTAKSKTHVSASRSGNDVSEVNISVNGKKVEVPPSSTVSQTVTTPDNKTNIDISVNSQGTQTTSTNSFSSSSVNSGGFVHSFSNVHSHSSGGGR